MSIEQNPTNRTDKDQDTSVADLKAMQAREAAIPPEGERDSDRRQTSGRRIGRGTLIGVGAALAGSVAAGVFALGPGSSSEKPNRNPGRSEAPTSASASPSEAVPTQEVEQTPSVEFVTVAEYPTVEDAAKKLYEMEGEVAMLPDSTGSLDLQYYDALYGVAPDGFAEGRSRDLIGYRDAANNYINQVNETLKEYNITDQTGEPLQYEFTQEIAEVLQAEGNVIHFISKVTSNYDDMPHYKPELGNPFAYEFGDELPKPGRRDNVVEFLKLDQVDGRWIVVDAGSTVTE